MAEDKNKIIIYKDWSATFGKLTDEEAGRLIKHFFRYINDENPDAPDRITEIAFEPIKQTLDYLHFNKGNVKLKGHQIRAKRLSEARAKGTHTKQQWIEMLDFFDWTCCNCFGESGLENVEKDHIVPLYLGGSDSIRNLQPLCARCNNGKSADSTDRRPKAASRLHKVLPEIYTNAY